MKILFNKYPLDIILCILWNFILIPISFFKIEETTQIILGIPFVIFIPGYVLTFALFPVKKTYKGIDIIERITLSFGFSIAIVSLIGLGLNFTRWGIRLESVLFCLFVTIIVIGIFAIYRWIKTIPNERFIISFDLSLPKSKNMLDRILTIILVVSLIITIVFGIYFVISPKSGEKFTELYILGKEGNTIDYTKNLAIGENSSIIIGLINHEQRTINYTIEIWLINQTFVYNEVTNKNETIYNHMWFMDKINIILKNKPIGSEELWEPQWEYNYTFNISRSGDFKLVFLLFTITTNNYNYNEDYKGLAEEKINSAYRENHIWVNVN